MFGGEFMRYALIASNLAHGYNADNDESAIKIAREIENDENLNGYVVYDETINIIYEKNQHNFIQND
jgi:hypothetical protein